MITHQMNQLIDHCTSSLQPPNLRIRKNTSDVGISQYYSVFVATQMKAYELYVVYSCKGNS
jgi:hypothetical protein